jgi:ubiquinone/menaquinone biosynthesis C-methylase UbiE
MSDIEIINDHQKQFYGNMDKAAAINYLKRFDAILSKIKDRENIKILDIGGGGGYFSLAVREYFSSNSRTINGGGGVLRYLFWIQPDMIHG